MAASGRLNDPRGAGAADAADAGRPARPRAGGQPGRPVAAAARAGERRAGFAGLRRQPALLVQARDRAAVRIDPARGPQHPGSAASRLHVPGRAAGPPLRHPERARQPLPPRHADATTRAAACSVTAACSRRRRSATAPRRSSAASGFWRTCSARRCRRRRRASRPTSTRPRPATRPTSLRQRMERHRASPACASCHAVMDPIGFSLENFDLAGKWRDSDGGVPVAPRVGSPTGRLSTDRPASGRRCWAARTPSSRPRRNACSPTRWAGSWSTSTCPPCAAWCETRPGRTTASRRWSSGSCRARRSR